MTTHQPAPDVPPAATADGTDPSLIPYSDVRPVDPELEEPLIQLTDAEARYWAAMDDPQAYGWERIEAAEMLQEAEARVHQARLAASRVQADPGAGHVDPAAAARWHQAQTELVDQIRADNRVLNRAPEAERTLPPSLADWMTSRVTELEQAEATQPEAEL